jgi:hypothetical protein
MNARAARADIHRALHRHLAVNDPERAAERADALLNEWAHELVNQQRQEMHAPGRSYDAARWNRCVDMVAAVIDPAPPTPQEAPTMRCLMHYGDTHAPAVAWLVCSPSRKRVQLCQACLDMWFDNADEDNHEPAAWGWLASCRPPATGGTVTTRWPVVGEEGCTLLVPPGWRRQNLGLSLTITDMAAALADPASHEALVAAVRSGMQDKPLHQLTGRD